MEEELKKIIDEAIKLSNSRANLGVRCIITSDGRFATNYVPFKRYIRNYNIDNNTNTYAIERMIGS